MKRTLTCIECPIGCEIEVRMEDGKVVSLTGNGCLRGKAYAEAEVVCPKRVVTSTVRAENGEMIPVKTDKPIPKEHLFDAMEQVNRLAAPDDAKTGDVLLADLFGANLVATADLC